MYKKWLPKLGWILSAIFFVAFIAAIGHHHRYKEKIVEAGNLEICKDVGRFAFAAEKTRQLGYTQKELLDSISQNTEVMSANQVNKALILSIIDQAFSYPLYFDDTKKQEAEVDFSNAMYLICVRGMAK